MRHFVKGHVILYILFLSVLVVAAVFWGLYQFGAQEIGQKKLQVEQGGDAQVLEIDEQSVSSPDPLKESEFYNLTIDYLRGRKFQSQLSEVALIESLSNGGVLFYKTSYDSDGLLVNALMAVPQGDKPVGGWPGIVLVHGYIPPNKYTTDASYFYHASELASRGFVVLKPDLRGHGQSEGEALGAYYSSDYVIDTLNAYSALQKFADVNPEKIGLWGHSMGGNIVMRSIVAAKDIPAAVLFAGAVYTYQDFRDYGIDDPSWVPPDKTSQRTKRRERLFAEYGEFSQDSDFWKRVVPTNYLQDVKTRFLILHVKKDSFVSPEYSRNLYEILKSSSIDAEYVEFENGNHNIAEDEILFFDKNQKFYSEAFDLK